MHHARCRPPARARRRCRSSRSRHRPPARRGRRGRRSGPRPRARRRRRRRRPRPAGVAGAASASPAAPTLGATRSTKPCSSRNSAVWNPSGSSSPTVPLATRAPGEADERACGSAMIASPSEAKLARTPPVVGIGEDADEWHAGLVEPHERSGRLGELHQREGALLHARPARARRRSPQGCARPGQPPGSEPPSRRRRSPSSRP